MIAIHVIQNHSPANLNRDDLGAPKSCYFGGVLRSRISSQCLKRAIRLSEEFSTLLGGVRTRQLARLISERIAGDPNAQRRAEQALKLCGFLPKKASTADDDLESNSGDASKALVYTTWSAIDAMAEVLRGGRDREPKALAADLARIIQESSAVPDMALSGRMLEPDKSAKEIWKDLDATVEASLQAAHAISTHEARPEIDYYVAADDMPGTSAGAGYVDEALFASACFYKYFCIDFRQLVRNLNGSGTDPGALACHTVAAFLRAAALANPSGKQNSYAAHNPPDGIMVELRDSPMSYANAFAQPVDVSHRDITAQSIAQLASYVQDLDVGYGPPAQRLWFSPNQRYPLVLATPQGDTNIAACPYHSLDDLTTALCEALGYSWSEVSAVHAAGVRAQ